MFLLKEKYKTSRHPGLPAEQVAKYQETNTFFACFITRIVGFLPGDIVSIYFGACGTAYGIYLAAGITGSLLSIITTTLLGEKISDPFSVEFMIVLLFPKFIRNRFPVLCIMITFRTEMFSTFR